MKLNQIVIEDEKASTLYPNCYRPIPSNGQSCPHTGLKHAKLYKLLSDGGAARAYVRIVQLRDPGASKGITLYHVGDLLRFLDGLAAEQKSGEFAAAKSTDAAAP